MDLINAELVDPVLIWVDNDNFKVNYNTNTVTANCKLQTPDGSEWGVTFSDMPRNNTDWNLVDVQSMINDEIQKRIIT